MLARIRAAWRAPDGFKRLKDFIFAKALFSLPPGVRRQLFAGEERYCPLCQSRLERFLAIQRLYHLFCPVCRSLQRHRLVWLLLEQGGWLDHPPGERLKLLHFAPEACLEERFRRAPGVDYLSADLYDRRAMVRADIVAMQFESETFDLVFCSHVLEHVPEDRKAINELSRILKPGGKAVILVPIRGEETDEDPAISDPVERERRFGQLDHVRSYGMDILQRLERAGFSVRALSAASLEMRPQELERMGLEAADIVFICRK